MKKDIKIIIAEDFLEVINNEDSRILQDWLDYSEENRREYGKMRDVLALNGALSCKVSNMEEVYHKVTGRNRRFRKYAYAISSAAAIIGLFIGLFTMGNNSKKENSPVPTVVQNDEIVFISNGNSYKIDSNTNKINLGGTEILNNSKNKMIAFKDNHESTVVVENKIIVPSGQIYKIVLSDGTQVTLNAKSILTFPSVFKNGQRIVRLEGEALFDVVHDSNKQFVVKTNKSEVRVYGTVFNVNAYDVDNANVVSLISGSVVTSNGKVEKKLSPGEQATIESQMQIQVNSFNVDEVMSWEKKKFLFDDKPLCDIVSAMERWYGVKFKFMNDNLKNVRAYVKVTKNTPLSELLELIAATNKVRFESLEEEILIYSNK